MCTSVLRDKIKYLYYVKSRHEVFVTLANMNAKVERGSALILDASSLSVKNDLSTNKMVVKECLEKGRFLLTKSHLGQVIVYDMLDNYKEVHQIDYSDRTSHVYLFDSNYGEYFFMFRHSALSLWSLNTIGELEKVDEAETLFEGNYV
jgi:hypothetical protein